METQTEQALRKVQEAAKLADASPRVIERMKVGQVVRQGDVYLHCVAAGHPQGVLRTGEQARQLAVGNQRNARHVAEPPAVVYEGVKVPPGCEEHTFLGPLLISDAPFVVTHPEHAPLRMPAGTYQVTHQMDARTLGRVRD